MLSFFTERFNPINQSEFYPKPRSEGRVKSHDSCSDFRAWSLHEQDLHDYLVYIIKLNDVDPHGFLSKKTLFDLISGAFGVGTSTPAVEQHAEEPKSSQRITPPQSQQTPQEIQIAQELADIIEDEKCLESMLKKDEQIDNLKNELDNWEKKYNDLLNRLNSTEKDKDRLSEHNAELVRSVDRFSVGNNFVTRHIPWKKEHIDTLSDLKDKISEYAECGQLLFGNNDKYKQILEDTLKAVVGREHICTNKELKKERKRYEDKIREQLAKMLEMYENAINCLKQKDEELQRKNADLDNLKLEQELMTAKCICGREDHREDGDMVESDGQGHVERTDLQSNRNIQYTEDDNDNDSIATIDDIQISTSAPMISIEMTQNVNPLRSRNFVGHIRGHCRDLHTTLSEQRIYEESVEHSVTRRHRVSAHSRNFSVISSGVRCGNPDEYVVQGSPSIQFRLPFTNYTFILKPDF